MGNAVLSKREDMQAFQYSSTQAREFTKKESTEAHRGENFTDIHNIGRACSASNKRSRAPNRHLDLQYSQSPAARRDQSTHGCDFRGSEPLDRECNAFFRASSAPNRKPLVYDWTPFRSKSATKYNAAHQWISAEDRSASRPFSGHRKPEMGRF